MKQYLVLGGTHDGKRIECEPLPTVRIPNKVAETHRRITNMDLYYGDSFPCENYHRHSVHTGIEDITVYLHTDIHPSEIIPMLLAGYPAEVPKDKTLKEAYDILDKVLSGGPFRAGMVSVGDGTVKQWADEIIKAIKLICKARAQRDQI